MNKKPITGILIIALLATVLFMNFASAPATESKVEIKDKRDEHILVVPGTQFCVERTLRNKDIAGIKPVIVPLFSEGATLESIEVKRIIEEPYMVNIPDWGICQRKVKERFDYDEVECDSLGCSWNVSCYCEVDIEEYPCVTGYHEEERVRDVVTYEPVLEGEYPAGEFTNGKEIQVEMFREQLPSDLQDLKHVGYSLRFDLEDEATIRLCFRAPPWGSAITSGRISYLTYYGDGYDYESSTEWYGYNYRRNVSGSNLVKGMPYVVNGSGGAIISGQKQLIWTKWTDASDALYYNNSAEYNMGNNTALIPQEIEDGGSEDYQNTSVWDVGEPFLVWHLNGDATDSSSNDLDGTETNFDGDEYITGYFGKAVNLSEASQDYITFSTIQWDPTIDFTLMCWVKTTDTTLSPSAWRVGAPVLGDLDASVRGGLGLDGGNITYVWYDGSSGHEVTGSTNVADGNWHFLAWVNNGSATHIYLYVDGILDVNGTSGPVDNPALFNLDAVGKEYALYFNGTIDEIRFWNNTFFTADMVNATYQNAIGTAGYGDLGAEESEGGGGGTDRVIRTSSENLILSPASGTTEVNGSLDVSGDFLWIDNNNCPSGKAVQNITSSGTLQCISVSGGGGDMYKSDYDTDEDNIVDNSEDLTCSNCIGGTEIDESSLSGTASSLTAGDVSCTNCIGGTEIDESSLSGTASSLTAGDVGCTNCLTATEVASADISYDLSCTNCIGATEISDGLGVSEIDESAIQRRVTGSCSSNQAIRVINEDGLVTCETVNGSGAGCDDTNASSICDGTDLYLDGNGNCDNLTSVYVNKAGDTMTGTLDVPKLEIENNHVLSDFAGTLVINWDNDYSGILMRGDNFQMEIDNISTKNLYPLNDNASYLGKATKRWSHLYAVNQTIGDLREEYIENPNYDYDVGDVVAMDLGSEYEIKPLTDLTDRIIGVVSELPHNVTEKECDPPYYDEIREEYLLGECRNVTYHIDMSISIYGKFSPVKVKGTIHVGDYLVASDEPGVVTSMYDKEHPVTPSLFKKSKKKNEYNVHAKMLPSLGIAMEDYDSEEVGTIKVVLGK